jgi:hypothetical protein
MITARFDLVDAVDAIRRSITRQDAKILVKPQTTGR